MNFNNGHPADAEYMEPQIKIEIVEEEKITKEEIDKLWRLYRGFCLRCNQAGMTDSATEFISFLERYRL